MSDEENLKGTKTENYESPIMTMGLPLSSTT